MQRGESVILLAESQPGLIVGFCQMYPIFCSIEAKAMYSLSDLYVKQGARRSGVGRALLQAAEEYAASHGRVKMELTTAKSNKAAQAAYESLGWLRDEIFHAYGKKVGS
jgi:ribosomal protein S18 acetylase RimI-like enzyme